MTAIARLGGEWTIGYAADATRAFTGVLSGTPGKFARVEPGRTGGAMYSFLGGITPGEHAKYIPQFVVVYADEATRETHRPIGEADMYVVPIEHFLIGRIYYRINEYPGATFTLMDIGAAPRFGIANAVSLGVQLDTGGRLRGYGLFGGTGGSGFTTSEPADPPYDTLDELVTPLDEWVMLECATSTSVGPRSAFIRVTMPGQEPVVIFRRCNIPPPVNVEDDQYRLHGTLHAGLMHNPARLTPGVGVASVGFRLDVDDMGLNTSEGEENDTWLGPGAVRVARPIADGDVGPAWDVGLPSNIYRGEEGRTVANHGECCMPEGGLQLDESRGDGFYQALNNNPILNTATAPALGTNVRGRAFDRVVTSVGTDWHVHPASAFPFFPDGCLCFYVYRYDEPRIAFGGDTLELVCDASDREGDLSFARVVAAAGRTAWFGGPSDTIQYQYRGDFYFSMWTDNEDAPLLGGPDGGGVPTDWAHTHFGIWLQTAPNIDASWRGALARMQQLPELAETPTLSIRREHFEHAVTEGGATDANGTGEPAYAALQEFLLLGVGVVYESGYVPQEPLPTCEPGELHIGDMTNHYRQGRLRVGNEATG